jgi:hypothetical protein
MYLTAADSVDAQQQQLIAVMSWQLCLHVALFLLFCGFLPAVCATGLRCELSSGGFAAGNTFSWSTSLAAGMGCGWHQPTSHCACPLNFCLMSGNYAGRLMIGQPSRLCFLYAEGLVPRKQHYSGVWCIQRAHTCSHWTSTVGCASCACMRSLAFRRGMGDSAQYLLHAGAVTLSHQQTNRERALHYAMVLLLRVQS